MTEDLRRVAEETFGWRHLRDEQLKAMRHVLAGHDVLVVLPTGAGKSAIYQTPTVLLDGPTVVVSPLIALQHDQLDAIEGSDAPRAVAVNSTQRGSEQTEAWEALRAGEARYVFLSPEQLAKPEVVDELTELQVSLFVVDEAHCVSSWGHDFRPEYLRLAPVIGRLGHPPVLALTATAAPPVRADIAERLGLRDPVQVVASFDRPNLHLSVQRFTEDAEKRNAVTAHVRTLTADPATRCGLVYTASRKDAESHAEELARIGVRAAAYHAGMKAADRERVHEQFMAGELDVVAATSAFGMGIDKPDVRFVVHASVPDSLDSYYQQIGRAGRDGDPAHITLCYRAEDLGLQRFLTAANPPEQALDAVAQVLHDEDGPVALKELEVDASPAQRTRAVNLLEQAGAVTAAEDGTVDLRPDETVDHAVSEAVEVAERHRRMLRSRLHMLRGYAETTGCRRQYLLGYFGERLDDPCGNCDTCEAGTAQRLSPGTDEFPLNGQVRHAQWGHGVVMSIEEDRMAVLFDEEGYKILSLDAVREQNLLAPE
ncbi:RecQ family ATP-dependent DNA helicase [Kutzneria kofuensis]|uniref:ATP-dependent DNA helicase RecQ n=1 Tax=Kutzneria kofuensis TaxID=103725 RepID=A0A7W9KRG7_9PSEU|nr:ATP-dependent DNA helicase RecQ [Kutzneria kofuensis]MBB5897078.1 ATP-dependent DNA helicase RecQ [Kutzneria kofuensis]